MNGIRYIYPRYKVVQKIKETNKLIISYNYFLDRLSIMPANKRTNYVGNMGGHRCTFYFLNI